MRRNQWTCRSLPDAFACMSVSWWPQNTDITSLWQARNQSAQFFPSSKSWFSSRMRIKACTQVWSCWRSSGKPHCARLTCQSSQILSSSSERFPFALFDVMILTAPCSRWYKVAGGSPLFSAITLRPIAFPGLLYSARAATIALSQASLMFSTFGSLFGAPGIWFEVQIAVQGWLRQRQVLVRIILIGAHNLSRYRY